MHTRLSLVCSLALTAASCGTTPASDVDAAPDVDPVPSETGLPVDDTRADGATDVADARPADAISVPSDINDGGDPSAPDCETAPGFPSEAPPFVFTTGVIYDMVPLGDGVAFSVEHNEFALEPGGHVFGISPDGIGAHVWGGSLQLGAPQLAAIEGDLLLAAAPSLDGPSVIERRGADLELIWMVEVPEQHTGRPVELVGGESFAMVLSRETPDLTLEGLFLQFSAEGGFGDATQIADLRSVELASGGGRVAGALLHSREGPEAEFWMLSPNEGRVHTLSRLLSTSDPAIAWTGSEWAVAFQEWEDAKFEIFISFVSADGSEVTRTTRLSEPGQHAVFADIAAHPGGVTVVWQTGAEQPGVMARTVATDGSLSPIVPVATEDTSGALLPVISWTGDRLAVGWTSYTESLGYRGLVAFGQPICPTP